VAGSAFNAAAAAAEAVADAVAAAEEAYSGSCTAKTTIYCANVAAGLMLAQFTKWLRRLPVEPDISLNLLTNELVCLPTE
jgi:sulfur carrier protein ThiS adenylyltransferase